jgi:AraC-like DNA-binding protein
MGITPGHLSDLIHDNLGYPPRDVKRSVRYQVAMNYLLHSSLSISEIAEAAGFRSVYAFSRFFKNASGESPLAFRRKHKKNQSAD